MFVDWAGATIPIHNRSTGEITQAPLFVATLGVSSYSYAEVARNQQLDSWIQVNMHALEFYEGVPQLCVPDNTKTGVTKACRYDPDLNPTYQEFAMHYGTGVLPTRYLCDRYPLFQPPDGRQLKLLRELRTEGLESMNWISHAQDQAFAGGNRIRRPVRHRPISRPATG
jgi:hypothetical protein